MLDEGVIAFIQKPFTMESLAGVLQKITPWNKCCQGTD